jgi:hypothetical protein
VPGLERDLWEGFAGRGIDDLNIERQRHTRVAISDVLANVFTRNPFVLSVLAEAVRSKE